MDGNFESENKNIENELGEEPKNSQFAQSSFGQMPEGKGIEDESDCTFNQFENNPTKEPTVSFGKREETENDSAVTFHKIDFSPVTPVEESKKSGAGIKIFALLMAAIILLTGATTVGYYFGQKSTLGIGSKPVNVNLAARPQKGDEMTPAQVYEKTNKSVVGIIVYNSAGDGAQASGVVYSDDGYIITNDHIYANVPSAKFKIYTFDGKEFDAEYVAGDQISDIAVLKIKNANLTAAVFGNSDDNYCGQNVVAIGRPSDARSSSTITDGIISSTGKRVKGTTEYTEKLIQTNSAINPGSSGGALVNMYGQVIGITSSKLAGENYDSVSYAIPTVTVKRIADELIKNGKIVTRGKLGISYKVVDSVLAEINNSDYVGLYIVSVSKDSDLFGKVKQGDVITKINGIEIKSDDIILDIIENSKSGDKINVTVISENGAENNYKAVLKTNTGKSSYSDKELSDDIKSNNSGSSEKSDGTFDFPGGE